MTENGYAAGPRAGLAEPIAIVGMACIFPGAPDLATYWRNIVASVDAIGDPPPGWGTDDYFDPDSTANDRVYCRRGGWLGDLARFDPLAHKVMPTSIDGGEPDQFLALEVASRALDDAGGPDRIRDRERASVIIGRGTYINRGFSNVIQHGVVIDQTIRLLAQLHPEHSADTLAELKVELKASLPPFNAEMAPGLVPNVMSGRIANRLDLMGPNYTVDAACASSLLALDLAIQDLRAGRSDLVLVGGVHVSTPAPILQIFCQLEALSRSGQIRPFDERADGTLLGEGLGFVVLKRASEADRYHDRVYALIRAVGSASDGRAQGLLTPRVEGEELAVRRAYQSAGIDPRSVELLEAHGTGTPVGDAAEIEALRAIFGEPDSVGPTVALGTVKSMISHLIPASGIAGVIKTALALHHRVLPPTLHCERVNPELGLDRSRFYLNTRTRPWVHGAPTPRRAGVDSFGFGGINAHAILEEHPDTDSAAMRWGSALPAEVVVLDASSRDELGERAGALAAGLDDGRSLAQLAAESAAGLSSDPPERLAVVAATKTELGERLRRAAEALGDHGRRRIWGAEGTYYVDEPLGRTGRMAMVFPGEGSQYVGMLAETALAFPVVRRWFDLVDRAFAGRGWPPSRAIFPPPGTTVDDRLLWQMDVGPAVLFAASQGLLALLGRLRLAADAVVGHSTGEWSALIAAGALSVDDDDRIVRDVAAMHAVYQQLATDGQVPHATLLTVGSSDPGLITAEVAAAGGRLQVALDNCPHQVVLCGDPEAAARAAEHLSAAGSVCEELKFDRAYHTDGFASFAERVRRHLDRLEVRTPVVDLWSCSTAGVVQPDPDAVRDAVAGQWAHQVRFRETVEAMHADGIRLFIEVGPRANLTAFVDDTLRGRPHLAVPTDHQQNGLAQLPTMLAQLLVHRVPLQLDQLYVGRDLGPPATAPVNRARPLPTQLPVLRLPPSRRPAGTALAATAAPAAAPPASAEGARDRVVRRHLELMQSYVGTQTEIVHAALAGRVVEDPTRLISRPAATERREPPRPAVLAALPPALAERPPNMLDELRALLQERTGYPEELLGDDLDLEADLGVDSIKRVEILGVIQRQRGPLPAEALTRLRRIRTLRGIAEGLAAAYGAGSAPPEVEPVDFPYLDEISEFEPGERLVARCMWNVAVDGCLADHTIERQRLSRTRPELVGLPVVPLTANLELAAEAAAALAADRELVVSGITDIAAHRWTTLDDGARTVRVVAARTGSMAIAVRIEDDVPNPAGRRLPYLTATVHLTAGYPAPQPGSADVADLAVGPAPPPDHLFYGPDGLFHGPAFQVVRSVASVTASGAKAVLDSRGLGDMLGGRTGRCCLDPALLDGPGQVLAHWLSRRDDRALDIFPVRIEALRLYGPPPGAGERFGCAVRVRECAEDRLLCDLELVDRAGGRVAELRGWQDVRIDLPEPLRSFLSRPDEAYLAETWAPPGESRLCGRRLELPAMVAESGELWLRVLAHTVLGPAERPEWLALAGGAAQRRLEWLSGRIAVKEAVRDLLRDRGGPPLANSDIQISASASTPPRIVEAGGFDVAELLISISHTEGIALAVATAEPGVRGVGVDVQRVGSVASEVEEIGFSRAESELLDEASPLDRPGRAAQLWCAKEAVGKAAGIGLSLPPADTEILRVHWSDVVSAISVRVPLDISGAVLHEVRVWVVEELAYAVCWCVADPPLTTEPRSSE